MTDNIALIKQTIDTLAALCKAATPAQQDCALPLVFAVARDICERLDYNAQPKFHETIRAHELGGKVRHEQYGADIVLKKPKAEKGAAGQDDTSSEDEECNIEHKNTTIKRKGCGNVNMKLLVRKAAETDTQYADRMHAMQLAKGDLKVTVRIGYDPRLSHDVDICKEFVAEYVRRHALRGLKLAFNWGGRVCDTCHRLHRLDEYAIHAVTFAEHNSLPESVWDEIFKMEIHAQCK